MLEFRQKIFYSRYDMTDNLKRMKDSDILAEKERHTESRMPAVAKTAQAAAVGGLALGTVGAARGLFKKGGSMARGFKRGGMAGAIIGGGIVGAKALNDYSKEKEQNEFYNNRLRYAQAQARRREIKDWKTNMTQRDGYSF